MSCNRLPDRCDSARIPEILVFVVGSVEVVIFVVRIVEASHCFTLMHYTYLDIVDRLQDVGSACPDAVNSAVLECMEAKVVLSKEAGIRELEHGICFVINLAVGREQGRRWCSEIFCHFVDLVADCKIDVVYLIPQLGRECEMTAVVCDDRLPAFGLMVSSLADATEALLTLGCIGLAWAWSGLLEAKH